MPSWPLRRGPWLSSANRLDSGRDLKTIHDNALIFLYRLIFILYAESRGLLPKDNPKYWNGPSLQALKLEVAGRKDKGEAYDDQTTRLWARLRRLFKMINEGDESFGIPPYNGGLFKPDKQDGHPFLEKMRLGDSVVAEIVDLVARRLDKETGALVPVDYRSLGVRQLGSIYEGLLEFKLTVATEPMVAVKEKGKELVVPKTEVGNRKVLQVYKPGDLYVVNDKGERKATGSYFTPEYIVDYIVKHAIGPLLEGKSAEDILKMRFLDPAMGSGHFLVQVVDFVALHLVEQCPDVYDFLKGDEEDEAPALKRLVVERCVYGVDLNPLAVELAKLSLWLTCVAKDKPLSFLNHHLRCGNSLIGAWLKDLGNLPVKRKAVAGEQGDLFRQYFTQDVCRVLSGFKQIEELPSDSIRNIHKKEKVWDSIREELKPYERIADLWVSTFFGNDKVDGAVYQDLVTDIRHGEGLLPKKRREEVLTLTQGIAKEKCFFHWEIAFPEAFFDRFGRDLEEEERGFDAVIGNPPYGVPMADIEKRYYKTRFISGGGLVDSYALFVEFSNEIIKSGGCFGMIIPNSLLTLDQFEPLRRHFLREVQLQKIVNLIETVFPEATISVMLLLYEKGKAQGNSEIKVYNPTNVTTPLPFSISSEDWHMVYQSRLDSLPGAQFNIQILPHEWPLVEKSYKGSTLVESLLEAKQGVKTGNKDKFLFDSEESELIPAGKRQFVKNAVSGSNLNRYWFISNEHLIYDINEMLKELSSSPRHTYESDFIRPKLFLQHIRNQVLKRRLVLSYDCESHYPLESVYILVPKEGVNESLAFLLAVLNSTFLDYIYSRFNTSIFITGSSVGRLPIRRIHFTTPAEERKKQVDVLKYLYGKGDEAGILVEVEGCLPKDEKGEFLAFKPGASGAEERSDVVHDFLAFLAERMIALHKERQDKAKQFTGWLREIKGIDTEALKTALKEFWTLDEDGMAQAFKAKKIRASAENWSEIKDELAKYRKAILALNVKIASADDLIDQIVYRLYGLTVEEIRLVDKAG